MLSVVFQVLCPSTVLSVSSNTDISLLFDPLATFSSNSSSETYGKMRSVFKKTIIREKIFPEKKRQNLISLRIKMDDIFTHFVPQRFEFSVYHNFRMVEVVGFKLISFSSLLLSTSRKKNKLSMFIANENKPVTLKMFRHLTGWIVQRKEEKACTYYISWISLCEIDLAMYGICILKNKVSSFCVTDYWASRIY